MKQLINAILLTILLTISCNSDKRININTTRQNNKQTEEFDVESYDIAEESKQGVVLPGLDHGLIQSPINILTKSVEHVNS